MTTARVEIAMVSPYYNAWTYGRPGESVPNYVPAPVGLRVSRVYGCGMGARTVRATCLPAANGGTWWAPGHDYPFTPPAELTWEMVRQAEATS